MYLVRIFYFTSLLAICSACLPACRQAENEAREEMFAKGLSQYKKALDAGVGLTEAGSFMVTNLHLFEEYRNVFFMPQELEPLVTNEAISFLETQFREGNKDAQELALILLEIIRSKRKIRRDGVLRSLEPFEGGLILYHYD